MKILVLSDSAEDAKNFCGDHDIYLFKIRQLRPAEHDFKRFEEIYQKLATSLDLGSIDLVIAEYIDSIPLVYLMRKAGHYCPALFIPHTNPYPLNILFYFILVSENRHPGDQIICGSQNSVKGYREITGIPAQNICTFGIKDIYQPADQTVSRNRLGLPHDRPILLYTGRFMNDKGLARLLSGYYKLRSEVNDALLVMSVTHIDRNYYNALAAELEHVVLFNWLDRSKTVDLYNSADVYVSAATSVFETYGKAPLEALACGIPAVVPRWDGFPYYINSENGALVEVDYFAKSCANRIEFAQMRTSDFAEKCKIVLSRRKRDCTVPTWGTYRRTMELLPNLVSHMLQYERFQALNATDEICVEKYPEAVQDILNHYGISTIPDLLNKSTQHGLIDHSNMGDEVLLRELHHKLFGIMDSETSTCIEQEVSMSGTPRCGGLEAQQTPTGHDDGTATMNALAITSDNVRRLFSAPDSGMPDPLHV